MSADTATPHAYFSLFAVCSRTEMCCLSNIIAKTFGARGRPERARIPRERFAEWAGCGLSTVDKALDRLEKLGLIKVTPVGRTREYQALPENFRRVLFEHRRRGRARSTELPR
jgi:hypothetical protein